jgi:hypothetical protein
MTSPSTQHPPPEKEQEYPGRTAEMTPRPRDEMSDYEGRGLLAGRRALITGGDSGIGRAVAAAFGKEGADVAIAYLSEQEDDDAGHTAELVGRAGRQCMVFRGDLAQEDNCHRAVDRTVAELGGLDVLVNNVATQQPVQDLAELSTKQCERTFRVNIFSYFWTTKAALRHLPDGGAIINTASINGLRGNKSLIDYAATKGAVLAFTYSPGPGAPRPGHQGEQCRAGPGLDAADPSDLRRREGRSVRQPGADGTRRASGRNRAVVRLLRQRSAVELLLRRGSRAHWRRDAAGLTWPDREWSRSRPMGPGRTARVRGRLPRVPARHRQRDHPPAQPRHRGVASPPAQSVSARRAGPRGPRK